jgi:hypothetical protein
MPITVLNPNRKRKAVSVLQHYLASADAKNRISLRGSKAKYFEVKALSNGSYMLEPRVLISPDAIPARTLRMLERSVAQLKRGQASAPINLARFAAVE